MPALPRIPPLLLAVLAALLMLALDAVFAWTFELPGNRLVAVVTGLAGTLLIVLAIATFRRARTTLDPRDPTKSSALVTHGVFAFSRNPIYVGFVAWLLAGVALLENWTALVAVCAFIIYMNNVQVPAEERALRELFGEAFEDYTRRVRRWL